LHREIVRTPCCPEVDGTQHIAEFQRNQTDEISGFFVGANQKFFQEPKGAACLVEVALFIYIFDDEVNRLTHIIVRTGGPSAPKLDVALPTLADVRKGVS
jgi:hypothetical protein